MKNNNDGGTLYWITGLSDSGKTTIGTLFYSYLKSKYPNTVFIDGDEIRRVYENTDYSASGRQQVAKMNQRLFKLLTDQGINVIAAVIGMKEEYRQWNKDNIKNYKEIYIKVPMDVLIKRDSKGLYAKALSGEISNVYGIDIDFEEPRYPDLIISNDGSENPIKIFEELREKLGV